MTSVFFSVLFGEGVFINTWQMSNLLIFISCLSHRSASIFAADNTWRKTYTWSANSADPGVGDSFVFTAISQKKHSFTQCLTGYRTASVSLGGEKRIFSFFQVNVSQYLQNPAPSNILSGNLSGAQKRSLEGISKTSICFLCWRDGVGLSSESPRGRQTIILWCDFTLALTDYMQPYANETSII